MENLEKNKRYQWDLTDLYPNDDAWRADFNKLQTYLPKILAYKGRLGEQDQLLDYLKLSDEYRVLSTKVYRYVLLHLSLDCNNKQHELHEKEIDIFSNHMSKETSFLVPELSSYSDGYYNKLIQLPEFSNYKLAMESIMVDRKYVLSAIEERALSMSASDSEGSEEIYDILMESELKYKPVMVNGKPKQLTLENYNTFLANPNRKVRTDAFNHMYGTLQAFHKSLGTLYVQQVKEDCCDLKLRNMKSYLGTELESDRISPKVYYNLIIQIRENLPLMYRYFELKKKQSGLQDFGMQDVYVSLAKKIAKTYALEEQEQIIKKSLSVLGPDWLSMLDQAFSKHWVDAYSADNKESGAYCTIDYGMHPYVFLNNNNDYRGLSTMAHELGHAYYAVQSNCTQPSNLAKAPMFLAEIGSTINEILLNRYMLEHAQTKQEKIFYLSEYIDLFKSAIFRQTMFAEFEDFAHKMVENEKPLTPDILDKHYLNLVKLYHGDSVTIDPKIKHEWLKIDHFYNPYYVYQYATSMTVSIYLANAIATKKEGALEQYTQFLKAGGSDYPTALLEKMGIHLEQKEIYDSVFGELKSALDQMEELLQSEETDTNELAQK